MPHEPPSTSPEALPPMPRVPQSSLQSSLQRTSPTLAAQLPHSHLQSFPQAPPHLLRHPPVTSPAPPSPVPPLNALGLLEPSPCMWLPLTCLAPLRPPPSRRPGSGVLQVRACGTLQDPSCKCDNLCVPSLLSPPLLSLSLPPSRLPLAPACQASISTGAPDTRARP